MSMEAWPTRRMDELCEITSSKRIFAADYVSEGVPFYRGKEITEKYKGNLDVSTELFISEEKFIEIERKFGAPKLGDLLLTSVGTLGSLYVVKPGDRFYFKDGNLTWFRNFKGLDSQFLYYWLAAPQGKAELQKCTIGSSQSAFTIVLLKGMEVELPPLHVQRRIAGILSAYDELIENSQRRIRLLEDMARALYREWFVHFRFPGHESVPRLPSALGDIPQGWDVTTLEEVTTKIGSGATPRGGKGAYKPEGISLIRSMNIYDYEFELADLAFIDDEQAAQLDNVTVQARDVLLNITGASVCRCSMVPSHLLPARVNQHVAIIRADTRRMDPFYLLDTINNDHNKQKLLNLAQGGATREALTKETICNFPILLPPRELLTRYGQVAGGMHAQRETLALRIQNLRGTRDLLLPRLLSGQVELQTEVVA